MRCQVDGERISVYGQLLYEAKAKFIVKLAELRSPSRPRKRNSVLLDKKLYISGKTRHSRTVEKKFFNVSGENFRPLRGHKEKQPHKHMRLLSLFFWLGWRDLNSRMTESESVALPLGDTPILNSLRLITVCAVNTISRQNCLSRIGKGYYNTYKNKLEVIFLFAAKNPSNLKPEAPPGIRHVGRTGSAFSVKPKTTLNAQSIRQVKPYDPPQEGSLNVRRF